MISRKIIIFPLGSLGFFMTLASLTQGAITGGVIGTNTTSKFLGIFGVILMILAVAIERHGSNKQK